MTQPEHLIPPNDTGSDTFARFKYQAHVTFPYCFELTRDYSIQSVFTEHIEDIALDLGSSWRFLQVKTRDGGLGPWTFSEVVRSGALHSLWRAFQAVGPSLKATYELQLEGALKNGDELAGIASGKSPDDAFRIVASAVGATGKDVESFAGRLRVRDLPLRRSIIADNLRLLGKAAPHLAAGEIERTYVEALVAIESAMTADRLEGTWPAALFSEPDDRMRLRIESKRISRDRAQQIFVAILRPVPASSDSATTSPTTRAVPFILPQLDVPTFTGRSDELGLLEAILLRTTGEKISSIAGVSGSGGIGKSALACHFAELHRNHFRDGVIGLRVDGKEAIAIAREFARCAFAEVDPDDDRDPSAIMQEIFRDRSALLIFDNADSVSVRELLPGGSRCAVIITTRDRGLPVALGIPDSAKLDLSPLSSDEAVALLERLVGERVVTDRDAASRISELVGNLPLAIQIAGATLQVQAWRPLQDYENELRQEKERLSVLRVRGDSELDVRASFSLSLRLLDSSDVDFFASLAVCAQDGFSILGAAASNGSDERTAQERLTQLFRLSLVNRSSAGASRFVLHPLLWLFAHEQAEERGLLDLAETRHRDFFASLVKTRDATEPEVAALLGEEIDELVTAAESMQRSGVVDYGYVIRLEPFFQRHGYWEKAANIFAAFLHSAERTEDWSAVVQLQLQQAKFLALRGRLVDAERLLLPLEHTVGRIEPEGLRRLAAAMVLNSLGGVLQRQGDFDRAVDAFRRSHDFLISLADVRGQAVVLNSLGGVLQRQGDFDRAVDAFRRSHDLLVRLHDTRGQAMVLNSLGGVLQRQGKFDQAVEALGRSAEIDRESGNRRGEAMTLNSLGGALQRKGDFDEAAEKFRRSGAIDEELGNRRGEAMTLNSLGGILQRQGDFDGAMNVLRRSEHLLTELGDARGEAMVLNSLGGVMQRKGDFAGAVEVLRRSATIEGRLGNERGEAMVLNSLGGVLQRQGKFDEAVVALRKSYAISEELHDQRSEAMVLNSLGGVLQRQGKFDEAVVALRKSYAISEELHDQRSEAMALNSLGGVLQRQGKFDEAVVAFRRSYAISEELHDQRSEAMVLNSLGGVLQRQGKFDEAVVAFRKSQAISEELHDQRSEAMVLNSLGGVLQRQGEFDEAVVAFRDSYELELTLENLRGQAMVLNSLGGVLQRQGKFDDAVVAFRKSYAISQELHDQRSEAMVLNSLGGVLQRQGKFDDAVVAFRKSHAISEELHDQRSEAMVLNSLGGVLQRQGKFEEAVIAFRKSYAISEELHDQRSEAMVLNSLGGVLQRQGKFEEAVGVFRKSHAISEELHDRRSEAMVLNSLGGVLQRQEKLEEAVGVLRRSHALLVSAGDQRGQAMVLNSLGGVLQRQGEFNEADAAFRESVAIGEKLRDKRHLAMVHTAFGRALVRRDTSAAVDELRKGFELDAELRNRKGVGIVAPILVEALMSLGRTEDASAICERALSIAPEHRRLLQLKRDLDSRHVDRKK
jgi:tetratricopeptide (TPR) repeat protein